MAAHGLNEATITFIDSPLDSLSVDLLAGALDDEDEGLAGSEDIDEEDTVTTPFRKPRGRPSAGRIWDRSGIVHAACGHR